LIVQGFVEWTEDVNKGFWIPDSYDTETGLPAGPGKLNLFEHQRRILQHVLTPDPITGLFPYSTIVYSCPKKSGKSKVAAAVAAWYAECADAGMEVYLIANDLESAEGVVYKDIAYHAKKTGYRTLKSEVQMPGGTLIKALAQSYRSVAGTRHGLTIWDELWGYCQSSNAQCYSRNGWKNWNEVQEGDLIATISHNGEWEWQPIQKVNAFDFRGEMVRLQHRRASQLMTKNHSVLGRFHSNGGADFSEIKTMRADDAMRAYEMLLPVGSDWVGVRGRFTDAQLYILGMWLAEGHYKIKTGKDKQIVYLAQNKGNKPTKGDVYSTIKHKLDESGQEYKESSHGFTLYGGLANWIVNNIPTGSFNKYIPEELKELTTQELYWLFTGYMEGDGWVAGKGWQVELVSERMADDFIEIGIKLGYIARYMSNHRTNLRLSFSIGNIRIDRRNWKYEDYEGVVWCPTVENGTWLVRNDGFISWTGNSSESARRCWDELTPIPTIPQSLRFISTYAGFEAQSDLLKEIYLKGVGTEEHDEGQGMPVPGLEDLPCYSNGDLFVYWDHEPRMPWQTDSYYCLPLPKDPSKLKVLTRGGWKDSVDVTKQDSICTQDKDGIIEYQHPTNIFRASYSGKLLQMNHTKAHLTMTPNHRVFAAFANHTRNVATIIQSPFIYEYREAEKARKAQVGWIPGHGNWNGEGIKFVDIAGVRYDGTLFIKLLAWYLSEGYVKHRIHKAGDVYADSVHLSQSREINPEKYKEIVDICEALQIKTGKYENQIAIYGHKFAGYFNEFGKSQDKYIPRWLLDEASAFQLKEFLSCYIKGDGTRLSSGASLVYTNSDKMKLDIMELAFKAGFRPRHIGSYSSSPQTNRAPIHHISILESHIGWYASGVKRNNWSEVEAEEGTEVWCPTLPNGNFYVMQDGVCYWTGNSSQRESLRASAYIRLHTNNWVTTNEEFIPKEWWERATKHFTGPADGWLGHPYYNLPVSIGVDAAIKRDCTAIVGCVHDSNIGKTIMLFHKIWTPIKGEWFDLEATVEAYLLEQAKKFNVISILCDPAHLHQTLTRLKFRGLPVVEYTQSVTNMVKATQQLYDSLKYENLWCYPADDLTKHIQLAVAQTTDTGFRLVKNKSNSKAHMDGAIATALAVYDAVKNSGIDSGEVLTIMNPYSNQGSNRPDPEQFQFPPELRTQ